MYLPSDTICSLPTTWLMIPAFFSSAKLINNEDDKRKEGGGRGLIFTRVQSKIPSRDCFHVSTAGEAQGGSSLG